MPRSYKASHSGWWDHELFLAQCELWKIFDLLLSMGFRQPRGISSQTSASQNSANHWRGPICPSQEFSRSHSLLCSSLPQILGPFSLKIPISIFSTQPDLWALQTGNCLWAVHWADCGVHFIDLTVLFSNITVLHCPWPIHGSFLFHIFYLIFWVWFCLFYVEDCIQSLLQHHGWKESMLFVFFKQTRIWCSSSLPFLVTGIHIPCHYSIQMWNVSRIILAPVGLLWSLQEREN